MGEGYGWGKGELLRAGKRGRLEVGKVKGKDGSGGKRGRDKG
jgi:hypothetical protein